MDSNPSRVHLLPFEQDPLAFTAEIIFRDHGTLLPDLSHVTLLVPHLSAAASLRRHCVAQAQAAGFGGLLGPHISSLREWALQFLPPTIRICDTQVRELMLVEALNKHPKLLANADPWSLTSDLLNLFDQLTLEHIALPADLHTFKQQLASGYGLEAIQPQGLGREASLVHTLWHALHQQLHAVGLVDETSAYLLALAQSTQNAHAQSNSLYLVGAHELARSEQEWLTAQLQHGQLTLVLNDQTGGQTPYGPGPVARLVEALHIHHEIKAASALSQALDTAYASATLPLQARAREFVATHPSSPFTGNLRTLLLGSDEEESRAIDVQIRQWLIEGKRRIGVVTENRRLARRLRALLERAEVPLQDDSGWALSTTSAAAVLERWLECVEEDCAHLPLLDLLKSPFIFHDIDADLRKNAVCRLEQDVIQHENIARGLARYRHHLLQRNARLQHWQPQTQPLLLQLLDLLQLAHNTLAPLLHGHHPARDFITSLTQSLSHLQMTALLEQDDAGARLLQVLEQMGHSAAQVDLPLNWLGFRTWLGRNLERHTFKPIQTGSPVILLGLGPAHLQRFDALIFASVEQEYLPGHTPQTPFFNDMVRRELGLATTAEHFAGRFYIFRELLESSPQRLITARREQQGEPVTLSPWLAILRAFHLEAWQQSLDDHELLQLIQDNNTYLNRDDGSALPTAMGQPRPGTPPEMVPDKFSPTDYDRLLACPYQYYLARCLQLAPSEEVSELLSKAEYGQRVHRCLQAFHAGIEGLPGPFKQVITAQTREAAIEVLSSIADRVFAADVEDNFAHHGWLQQWRKQLPDYVEWEIARQQQWQFWRAEVPAQIDIDDGHILKGRLDRIDTHADTTAVIDYKTGRLPTKQEVQQGEHVQLPSYALLAQQLGRGNTTQVDYVRFDPREGIKTFSLIEEDLTELSEANLARLQGLIVQIQAGHAMPAWGDEKTCEYCEMKDVCRRQVWGEE